jgi:hypothetical protein
MLPWGVAVARRLGVLDDLTAAGGRQPQPWITGMFGNPMMNRDMHDTRRARPGPQTLSSSREYATLEPEGPVGDSPFVRLLNFEKAIVFREPLRLAY